MGWVFSRFVVLFFFLLPSQFLNIYPSSQELAGRHKRNVKEKIKTAYERFVSLFTSSSRAQQTQHPILPHLSSSLNTQSLPPFTGLLPRQTVSPKKVGKNDHNSHAHHTFSSLLPPPLFHFIQIRITPTKIPALPPSLPPFSLQIPTLKHKHKLAYWCRYHSSRPGANV